MSDLNLLHPDEWLWDALMLNTTKVNLSNTSVTLVALKAGVN